MDLTTPGMASEFPGYSERYVLIDPPPPPSRFERAVGTIFRPEVIRYRNVNFSCTLVTAIKRRNPFCLLNPVVIHISW